MIHNQGEGVTSSTGEYEHYPLSITRVPWSKWGLKGGISHIATYRTMGSGGVGGVIFGRSGKVISFSDTSWGVVLQIGVNFTMTPRRSRARSTGRGLEGSWPIGQFYPQTCIFDLF